VAVHGFRRSLGGRIVLRTDDVERGILADLVGQLVEMVSPDDAPDADPLAVMVGIDPFAERPDDPALARLFPDAYPDDDEAASEFRRFTERSLRDTKMAHAQTVLDTLARSGDKVVLSDADAQSWLGTLNDLRLTIGSRLGLDDDSLETFAEMPESHPAYVLFHVYDWLTFLQETLVRALSGITSELPEAGD
jgi:Domain of unknown function (DUF2017)